LQHIEWLAYLLRRHPKQITLPAFKLLLKNLRLLTPRESEYPPEWDSEVWVPPKCEESRVDRNE
jgi:hypothetical protein